MPNPNAQNQKTLKQNRTYFVEEEYLVTAFVPSDTACLASSPGRMRRTLGSEVRIGSHTCFDGSMRAPYEVWISREEIVDFLLYAASLEASVATRSKMSGTR